MLNKERLQPLTLPSQQARLGVLATQNARIRKRMREGRGDDVAAVQSFGQPAKLCLEERAHA
jgi:hypothetical protein